MYSLKRKVWPYLRQNFLVTAGIAMVLIYNIPQILELEPVGRHNWRQTDCASFAWNYYTGSANLFTPAMNNVLSNGEGAAAAEFPLIYWLAGMLYRVFGPHTLLLRMMNIVIVFSGLWALSALCRSIIVDSFWAMFIPLLLYTSPFFVYYSSGFLPDPPALAICFWGWYFLGKHVIHQNKKYWLAALAFFTLGGLLKISMFIHAITAIILIVADHWLIPKVNKNYKRITGLKLPDYLIGFIVSLLVIFCWYLYATWYSTRFEYPHFTSIIKSVFQVSGEDITRILREIKIQIPYFFHPSVHILLAVALAFILWNSRKLIWITVSIPLLLCLGGIAHLAIFFWLIGGHEYYHLVNLSGASAILVAGAYMLNQKHPRISRHIFTRLIFSAFLVANIIYTRERMKEYYDPANSYFREKPAFYQQEFKDYLSSIGLKENQYVISIPDRSPNNTLYLLRKRGWSSFNNPKHYGNAMQRWTGKYGEIFLILSDTTLRSDTLLQPALYDKAGTYSDMEIYILHPKEKAP
ncbi:MAG: glycosyltransferase family 39 protein [Bacteroidia bacterium]